MSTKKLQHKVGRAWRDLGTDLPSTNSVPAFKRRALKHAQNTSQSAGHEYRIVTGRSDTVMCSGAWNDETIEWR